MDPTELPLDAKSSALTVGLSLAGFWRAVRHGRLPSPVYPLPKAPRWYPSELRAASMKTRALPANQAAARSAARKAT